MTSSTFEAVEYTELLIIRKISNDFVFYYSIDAEQTVTGVTLQQPFEIRSAYNNPKYTNFTVGFAACLDYIFYQANNLRMLQVTLPDASFIQFHFLYLF